MCISASLTVFYQYSRTLEKSGKEEQKDNRKHYGKEILNSIAEEHNEQMLTNVTDNRYRVEMTVENIK